MNFFSKSICFCFLLILTLSACVEPGAAPIPAPPATETVSASPTVVPPMSTLPSPTQPPMEIPTQTAEPTPTIDSCQTKLVPLEGVRVHFTAPARVTCQVYHVECLNILTLGGDCAAEVPANNVLWGRLLGMQGLAPLENLDNLSLPSGVTPAASLSLSADGFGITPASQPGSSQAAALTVLLDGQEMPLVLPFHASAPQATILAPTAAPGSDAGEGGSSSDQGEVGRRDHQQATSNYSEGEKRSLPSQIEEDGLSV